MKSRTALLAALLLLAVISGCVNNLPTSGTKGTAQDVGNDAPSAPPELPREKPVQPTQEQSSFEPYTGTFEPCAESESFSGELGSFSADPAFTPYKFSYPAEWEWEVLLGEVTLYPTENSLPSISVGRGDSLPTGTQASLENYDAYRINKRLKEDSGIDELDEACSTTLLGAPAHKVIYTIIPDAELVGKPEMYIKTVEIWAEKGGEIYMVSARSRAKDFDVFMPALNKVAESLELK